MVSDADLGIRLAIESALPEELTKAVERIETRSGWGGVLVVDVACTLDRLLEEFRDEIIDVVATVTGEARILLRIADPRERSRRTSNRIHDRARSGAPAGSSGVLGHPRVTPSAPPRQRW